MERLLDKHNKVEFETIKKDNSFDIINYGNNLNQQINYIKNKITAAEIKITTMKLKEKMIDDMVTRTNMLIEKYIAEKNYKISGINQSHLLTQFETLVQVQDMLIKFEDMIQRYVKMVVDIENHKLSAHVKLNTIKSQDNVSDKGYEKLMGAIQEMVIEEEDNNNNESAKQSIMSQVRKELKLQGY